MEVTKTVFHKYENGRLKGFAKVFLDDALVITTRIIQTRSGLVVAFPDHINKKGQRSVMAYPVDKELKSKIVESVLNAFKEAK